MNSYPPYQIAHIYLHQGLVKPTLDKADHGYYLVFWWQDIALGQVFIAPGTAFSDTDYTRELIKAITPTVTFYATKAQIAETDWQSWLKEEQFIKWSSWMRKVIPSENVPATVPVSIIVCTRNRALQLQRCLTMLTQLACQPAEIIVVDNAPSDNSSAEVVAQFKGITYVKEIRAGLDIARNTGIKHATCAIVAFADDDVVVHPLWVYQVSKSFEQPETAAMTGLVIASDLSTEAQLIFEKHWSFNRGFVDKLYGTNFIKETLRKGPPVWNIGAGANMAFRKEVLEKVGYFDELLDVGAAGCSGDSEMWFRILVHGYNIHYNPRAIVFHEHRKELEALQKQIFYYMRGHAAAALIQQKQYRQAGYLRYIFWRLPKQYMRLLKTGFPFFRYRSKTVKAEIMGVISGLIFYFRNKQPSNPIR